MVMIVISKDIEFSGFLPSDETEDKDDVLYISEWDLKNKYGIELQNKVTLGLVGCKSWKTEWEDFVSDLSKANEYDEPPPFCKVVVIKKK
jgi:hypothetical protein